MFLTQRPYIKKVVKDFGGGIQHITALTPMQGEVNLQKAKDTEIKRTNPYRQLIGCFVYLTVCTRPDIAFAVSVLAKFLVFPTDEHWKSALRLLAYLRDTSTYGLSLGGEEVSISSAVIQGQDKHLTAFVDSDWANNPEDYISVTGFAFYLGTSPVSWTAKKQKLVTLSSTGAEFITLCDVTREILWIQPLVESFKIKRVKEKL